MNECIFCKIINKEIPSDIIYEDINTIAILDIKPVNPGHTLIIPKEHSETILDTKEETLKELITITKKITPAILKATNTKAFNININNNKIAGQEVPHLHFHIIPRKENDNLKLWKGKEAKENLKDKIISNIS
jgi:histidine triad (HIT) family protein